jgi:hypothetical protein
MPARFPLPPGGQFPLSSGRRAGGAFPLPSELHAAILSLSPTAYWPLGDGSPVTDIVAGYSAPASIANEMQLVTIGGSGLGGTFTLTYGAETTGNITWSATNATLLANIDAALEALTAIGAGDITCAVTTMTSGIGSLEVRFAGSLAGTDVPLMTADASGLTGTAPTVTVAARWEGGSAVRYGMAAPSPIDRCMTLSGQYARASGVAVPTTSISVMAMFRTADTVPMVRRIFTRAATSQYSWALSMDTAGGCLFQVFQSSGTFHISVGATAAKNDGAWHLLVGTFDGTTATRMLDDTAAATAGSGAGSWHAASTAGVDIGALGGGALFPGDIAHCAIWNNRVITDAERRWLHSIALGG